MIHMLIQVSNNFLLDDENQQLVLIYLTINIYPSIQSHKRCVSNKVTVYTCNYMIHMLIQVRNNFLLDDENQQLVLIYLIMNIYPSIQSHKQCVSNKVTH